MRHIWRGGSLTRGLMRNPCLSLSRGLGRRRRIVLNWCACGSAIGRWTLGIQNLLLLNSESKLIFVLRLRVLAARCHHMPCGGNVALNLTISRRQHGEKIEIGIVLRAHIQFDVPSVNDCPVLPHGCESGETWSLRVSERGHVQGGRDRRPAPRTICGIGPFSCQEGAGQWIVMSSLLASVTNTTYGEWFESRSLLGLETVFGRIFQDHVYPLRTSNVTDRADVKHNGWTAIGQSERDVREGDIRSEF